MTENELPKASLPDAATFDEFGLHYNDTYISTFAPVVVRKVEADYNGNKIVCVELRARFPDNTESKTHKVLLSEIDEIDWFADVDSRCVITPDATRAKKLLAYIVQLAVSATTADTEFHNDSVGLYTDTNGVAMYRAGDILIKPTGYEAPHNIVLDPVQQKFYIDTERYPEREAFMQMKKLVSICHDAGKVILTQSLLGLTRSAYMAAGIVPSTVVEVIGPTNLHKTTCTSLISQLYNRERLENIRPIARLDSSVPAIEDVLCDFADCAVVLDDKHPAESGRIVRQNEETWEAIVRIVGDDTGRGRIRKGEFSEKRPRATVSTTGEYVNGKGSTAARCLVVPFTKKIDSQILHECQQEPLAVSTFYYYFLSWYIENYNLIQDSIVELLSDFRSVKLGILPRLAETQFCLFSSYMLFLSYALERGFISGEDADNEYASFWELLTSLVQEQDKRANGSVSESADIFELIRRWLKGGAFNLAKDAKRLKDHDGFIRDKCLYLRSNQLLCKINKTKPTATKKDVATALLIKGALKKDLDKNTVKVDGKRFYAILLDKLR